ncbi:ABC transporter substrate-binding protein [Halorientalis halophila]|uniref:ABC transporter substrate-binding protein n=1 Tax=Halorientalis halophila TaxID=3108499 RepID=UPI00300A0F70
MGLAGCLGGGGGGGSEDAITVGLQADLTGPLSTYGFWFRRVLEAYVDEINEDGGIDGREVELAIEDTETNAETGGQVFRRLAQQEDVDFVIGSFSSGVNIATIPLAKQMQVPYFPAGSAPSTTGEDGNRWTIRTAHDITQNAALGVEWGLENLGTNWTIIYQDYAFGQQWRDAIQEVMGDEGEILETIGVPVGESDLNSYLNGVPEETDVLFNALILPSSISFLKQSADLNTPGARFGDISGIEGTDISDIQDAGQGASFITGLPPNLDSEGNNHLRELADVDGANEALVRQYWVAYESLSFIREGIEASGWKSQEDHQAFIEWFETGPAVEEGIDYPQGDKFIRGEDHQAFMDRYITQVSGDELEIVTEMELSEAPLPPRANLAGQEF